MDTHQSEPSVSDPESGVDTPGVVQAGYRVVRIDVATGQRLELPWVELGQDAVQANGPCANSDDAFMDPSGRRRTQDGQVQASLQTRGLVGSPNTGPAMEVMHAVQGGEHKEKFTLACGRIGFNVSMVIL